MKYAKSKNGAVHLINEFGGEHTLCGWAFDVDKEDEENAWKPIKRGPVTCEGCAQVILSCRRVRIQTTNPSR